MRRFLLTHLEPSCWTKPPTKRNPTLTFFSYFLSRETSRTRYRTVSSNKIKFYCDILLPFSLHLPTFQIVIYQQNSKVPYSTITSDETSKQSRECDTSSISPPFFIPFIKSVREERGRFHETRIKLCLQYRGRSGPKVTSFMRKWLCLESSKTEPDNRYGCEEITYRRATCNNVYTVHLNGWSRLSR